MNTKDKIRKLLALARNNPNEHEAAAALAAARALERRSQPFTRRFVAGGVAWRHDLLEAVARAHGCDAYADGRRLYAYGRASDLVVVLAVYRDLAAEIERLAPGRGAGFHEGAAAEIYARLEPLQRPDPALDAYGRDVLGLESYDRTENVHETTGFASGRVAAAVILERSRQ